MGGPIPGPRPEFVPLGVHPHPTHRRRRGGPLRRQGGPPRRHPPLEPRHRVHALRRVALPPRFADGPRGDGPRRGRRAAVHEQPDGAVGAESRAEPRGRRVHGRDSRAGAWSVSGGARDAATSAGVAAPFLVFGFAGVAWGVVWAAFATTFPREPSASGRRSWRSSRAAGASWRRKTGAVFRRGRRRRRSRGRRFGCCSPKPRRGRASSPTSSTTGGTSSSSRGCRCTSNRSWASTWPGPRTFPRFPGRRWRRAACSRGARGPPHRPRGGRSTTTRKITQGVGFGGPALMLLVALTRARTPEQALLALTVAVGCTAFTQAGFLVNFQEIGPGRRARCTGWPTPQGASRGSSGRTARG